MNIALKNKLLIGGFITVLLLGYFVAIRDTIRLRARTNALYQEEIIFKNMPDRLSTLRKKEVYIDSLMLHHKIAETSLQNNLLQTIERYTTTNDVEIASIKEPHSFSSGGINVSSFSFSVKGDFKSILGLTYFLEQKSKLGMVSSLSFEKIKSYRNDTATLWGHFILQLKQ